MKASGVIGVILELKVVVVEPDSVVWETVELSEWVTSIEATFELRDKLSVVCLWVIGVVGVVVVVVVDSALFVIRVDGIP